MQVGFLKGRVRYTLEVPKQRDTAFWRERVGGYLLAVVTTGLCILARLLLEQLLEAHSPLLLMLLSVVAASAYGGRGPGILATVLGAVSGTWLFLGLTLLVNSPAEWIRLALFTIVGLSIAYAFGSAHLQRDSLREHNAHLTEVAHTDALTGLGNRRAFDSQLERTLGRAHRLGTPFGLAMIDVDRLKIVNDTMGHPAGDRLLQVVAGALESEFRTSDGLFRIGGDEFALILAGTVSPRTFELRMEEVQAAVHLEGFATSGLSVGLALYPSEASDATALLRLSDTRLYADKNRRRSRANTADPA